MTDHRITLSLVLHNHQPVGNFGWVLEENLRAAYAPMLDALERHPGVRIGLHYSGPLLDWLQAEKPGTITQLQRLVERHQVEILGGGYYEPVLASLPRRDRIGQLVRMADALEELFGTRPRGAWLAERVWEPELPEALASSGYEFTVLDDAHLRAAAIPPERHWGIYSTDDQGRRILIFGTEQGLRYRIPFRPVGEVIEYLREQATMGAGRIGIMGDDGEKFGAWPTTEELCWGEGSWVEDFFAALEAEMAWLTTLRPSDVIDTHEPIGRIYVPTGSYVEMGEWALPVDQRREYRRLLHEAQARGGNEAGWLRGGFWRNFQVNYSEIGALHKQMLRTSEAVAGLDEGVPAATRARIVDHLYQGQSNDCYWHGLFGGIYLSHMRLATLTHLIAAEDAVEQLARAAGDERVSIRHGDVDLDGKPEVLAATPGQVIMVKPELGGNVVEWDVRAVRHALGSVMRRRPEAYHDTLISHASAESNEATQGALSIHDRVASTEPGLEERLWYDDHDRHSGLIRILPADTTVDVLEHAEAIELGDLVTGSFEVVSADDATIVLERRGSVMSDGAVVPVRATKTIRLAGNRREPSLSIDVELVNEGSDLIKARLAVETSWNLLGGGGNPDAWIETAGQRHRFDTKGVVEKVDEVTAGNDHVGIAVRSQATPAAEAWWFSVETISLSEQGFERNHQGSCLVWSWPLRLEPGATQAVSVEMLVSTTRDLAADERLLT